MKVLVRPSNRSTATVLGDEADLLVSYPEFNREVSRRRVEGIGVIRRVEGTGRFNRRHVELRARNQGGREGGFRDAGGGRPFAHHMGYVPVSDAGEHIRVPQPDDLEAIDAIDQEVERLRDLIGEQRKLRVEAVKRAWRRGRKVTTRQLMEVADRQFEERQQRIAAAQD